MVYASWESLVIWAVDDTVGFPHIHISESPVDSVAAIMVRVIFECYFTV